MSCSNQEEALPRMFTAGLESGGPGPYCYHKSSFSLTPVAAGRNRSMEVESRRIEEATTEAAIETREEEEKERRRGRGGGGGGGGQRKGTADGEESARCCMATTTS